MPTVRALRSAVNGRVTIRLSNGHVTRETSIGTSIGTSHGLG